MKTFILGIGAQKAGTSWLYKYIQNDPNANLGQMKEYHYWDMVFVENEQDKNVKQKRLLAKPIKDLNSDELLRRVFLTNKHYYSLYFNCILNSGYSITGDITPQYSRFNEHGYKYIKKALEAVGFNVKVIYLIRDPVERLWSNIRMEKRLYETISDLSDADAVKLFCKDNIRWRPDSLYEITIRRLRKVFNKENIYIGVYEEMFRGSKLKELSNFIGINYNPDFTKKQINVSMKSEKLDIEIIKQARESFKKTYEFCYENFPQTKYLWKHQTYLEN